jgi:hypothetical protein
MGPNPTETTIAPSDQAPPHHLIPLVAAWEHIGWFKAVVFVTLVVGVTLLGATSTPLVGAAFGLVTLFGAFAVAEVVLRRTARQEQVKVPAAPIQQRLTRWTWVSLAAVVLLAAAFTAGMVIDGRWLSGLLGGVVFPVGALVDWWFLRRSSSEAARVADYHLGTVWIALFLLGWFTGALENLP